MNVGKRAVVIGLVASGVLTATPMITALATTKSASGGTWQYDATGTVNYSNYYHPSGLHRSSVANPDYGTVRSKDEPGGRWSYASEGVAIMGNKAYYNLY